MNISTHIRYITRAVSALLVLIVVAVSGTAAHAVRVAPPDGGGAPITNPPDLQQGTPFWVSLLVAAGSVVLTLIGSRLFALTRNSAQRRRSVPA